jgi:cation diffusion facilitator family transporter
MLPAVAASGGDPRKAILAALCANLGIAIAKFVAAWLSGSATMVAEGVHSLADTANQGLLLLGMALSVRAATPLYPFGRYRESYFWAFIVSLLLFFMGGVFAIYEGLHKLAHHEGEPGSILAPVIVLSVSILLEGGSFLVAFREFNKSRGGRSFSEALFSGKDPVIPLILLEDTGALFGLVIALVAVVASGLSGSTVADGIGSVAIGVLLCIIGLLLARDTRSLLIGEGIDETSRKQVIEIASATPGVEAVTQVLSLHLGPDAILLALKVRFQERMALTDVEHAINDIESRVTSALPAMKRIFIEPDRAYDPTKDANFVV